LIRLILDFQIGDRHLGFVITSLENNLQLAFDGPNILLKLHVDGVFRGYYPKWIPILSQSPKGPYFGENTSYEP